MQIMLQKNATPESDSSTDPLPPTSPAIKIKEGKTIETLPL